MSISEDLERILNNVKEYFFTGINSDSSKNKKNLCKQLCLEIEPQKEITLYHEYTALCAILAIKNEKIEKWLNNHFIPIYSSYDKSKNDYTITYCEVHDVMDEILDYQYFFHDTVLSIRDIIHYIKLNISKGNYIRMYFDWYYLPGHDAYQRYHLVHATFIYGYNDDEEKIYGVGYLNGASMDLMTFSYEEIRHSFFSAQLLYNLTEEDFNDYIELFSVKENIDVKFDENKFLFDLISYLASDGSAYDNLPKLYWIPKGHHYGQDAFIRLTELLDIKYENASNRKYHNFHILWEQRKNIYNRLIYYRENYINSNEISLEIDFLLEGYKIIVDECNKIRMSFLKLTISGQIRKDTSNYIRLSNRIKNILSEEHELLVNICNRLTNFMSRT